jgi:hypothetical protein
MLTHLADVSIRSLALALFASVVLLLLRQRRTAALQHAVWTAVVCGMLALFAFGQALPHLSLRVLERPAAPVVLLTPDQSAASLEALPPSPVSYPPIPYATQESAQSSAAVATPRPRTPINWSNVLFTPTP